MLSLLLYVWDF